METIEEFDRLLAMELQSREFISGFAKHKCGIEQLLALIVLYYKAEYKAAFVGALPARLWDEMLRFKRGHRWPAGSDQSGGSTNLQEPDF